MALTVIRIGAKSEPTGTAGGQSGYSGVCESQQFADRRRQERWISSKRGVWGSDIKTGNTIVSPAKPGPVSNPGDKEAHIEVGNAVNPALNQQMMPQGEWHVHPKGSGDRQFVQPPSGVDKTNAVFKTNIVVGAGNNRVYFYNSSGVVREMSLKQFMKEP